jgi:hypothetical protein
MITRGNVIQKLMTDLLIIQSYVYSDVSSKYWMIIQPLTIELSDKTIIHIPRRFTYDMATVPKWLWSFVRPFNDGLLAYLIHDYLYVHKEAHKLTRKQCDQEMLYWLKIINKKNFLDNHIRYMVVRLLGWLWWKNIV